MKVKSHVSDAVAGPARLLKRGNDYADEYAKDGARQHPDMPQNTANYDPSYSE